MVDSKYFSDKDTLLFNGSSKDDAFNSSNVTMTGNGYLGYRGAWPDWIKDRYPACVVTNTFDNADGKWKELCTVPNALYLSLGINGRSIGLDHSNCLDHKHQLNFRYGITNGEAHIQDRDLGLVHYQWERFASYEDLHLVVQKCVIKAEHDGEIEITTGIDTDVWSLNGQHFSSIEAGISEEFPFVNLLTTEKQLPITVAQANIGLNGSPSINQTEGGISQKRLIKVKANQPMEITLIMAVYSQNDVQDPFQSCIDSLKNATKDGYSQLQNKHKNAWDEKWKAYHVKIHGDDFADNLLRYNMYHNIISTPAHTDDHPIGARGLSCQAYQGAAFWDQEIYNLPMFLYTQPEVAKNILIYRHKTLAGAKAKAKKYGYAGAYYAWISGDTGEELCPDYFFIDVLSGRKIRNHFNDWQIHISPDISYTIIKYFDVTRDYDFIRDYGAEMLLEIGHFLHSRVHYRPYHDRYEIIRVLGPDEYHENADNNVFTNVQAKYALIKALEICDLLESRDPEVLEKLMIKTGITRAMLSTWSEIAAKLYIKQPDPKTKLIEQFDGYFKLEDITPDKLAERLQDTNEYWGWPNGIAFETQVTKQADVIQLFVLHEYPADIMKANYNYYEPRTQHRSSLSPGVHAIIAAQTQNLEQANKYYLKSCLVDISNTHPPTSGGTFIGGIHTAACGIAWQIPVLGFAGMKLKGDRLSFHPHLPQHWPAIEFSITLRGNKLHIIIDQYTLSLKAEGDHQIGIEVACFDEEKKLSTQEELLFTYK